LYCFGDNYIFTGCSPWDWQLNEGKANSQSTLLTNIFQNQEHSDLLLTGKEILILAEVHTVELKLFCFQLKK
jgi:hypothetical protein